MVDFIHTVAGYSERVFGAIFAVGSISLLIFSAFKSETGIGFIKKFGIFAVLIGALTTLSLVFNVTSIFSPLVDFFTFIKSSLYLFDFVVDIPYFFLMVGVLLKLITAYWSFLLVNFIVQFFKD